MEFTSPEAEQKYAALVTRGAPRGRRPRLRRHPVADRRRPRAGAHPPRRQRRAGRPGRGGRRGRGDHRPAGPPGARPRRARGGRERDRRRRQGALRVRPVRQRALELDPSTGSSRPLPPHGLSSFLRDLPRTLRRADAADAWVEDKGLALAVHTRRLPDPDAAFERLLPLLRELADRYGLVLEPGRHVIEVRAPGMDKGKAVERLVDEVDAGGVPVRRRRPRRRRGVRGGPEARPRTGCPRCWSAPPRPRRARWSRSPTSSCTDPRACSTCSGGSRRTRVSKLRPRRAVSTMRTQCAHAETATYCLRQLIKRD